jgi:flagellar hook-associated protein 1 FlgK
MLNLDLGLSALQASQVALRTASNNIANASTPGYHRQVVRLADRNPTIYGGFSVGTGVTVAQIRRQLDTAVEAGLLSNNSQMSDASVRQATATRLDALLAPGESSLTGEVTKLFGALEQLAGRPTEPIYLKQVVAAGQAVTREMNAALSELDRQQGDLRQQAELAVREVNSLSAGIAALNARISVQRALGSEPNDLLDQRDALMTQLSNLVDLTPADLTNDGDPFPAAGGGLLVGGHPVELQVVVTPSGELQFATANGEHPVYPRSGELAGLQTAHNELVNGTRSELLNWFNGLRATFDQIQSTGISSTGGFTRLQALQTVANPNAPLATLGSNTPFEAGDLYVTMTNVATGQRTTHRVAIDPSVDSLNSVRAQLDAIPGLSATLAPPNNQLLLATDGGYKFDFAGRLDTQPTPIAVTGTAAPTIQGQYTGGENTRWEIQVLDSGTVGVTTPLRMQVRDIATGAVLTTVDAGLNYEAGTDLSLSNGVTLRIPTGTLAAGDRWEIAPVANPDETGLVSGLGLSSFFVGGATGPFGVHPDLVAQPGTLAVSQTGLAADASNLDRFLAARSIRLYATNETIEDRLASIVALTGLNQQAVASESKQLQSIADGLSAQRDSISGVDPNQEMLSLLQAQQSFQAASRVVSIMQDTLTDLMRLIQ